MTLIVPALLMSQMVADARERQPHEACGLLLGTGQTVQRVIPLPNSDPQPETGFELDPQALVAALYRADVENLSIVGMYHSHPRSASFPSERDIKGAVQWPDAAQVIISLQSEQPHIQAWKIQPGQVERIDLVFSAREDHDQPITSVARLAIVSAALLAVLILIGLSISLLPAAPIITPVP